MAVILAIDTSGDFAHCAFRTPNGQIFERSSADAISHNEELTVIIAALAKQSGIDLTALAGIIIGDGPGSFTGLRIGLSVAKGMAYALRIPLTALSSHLGAALGSELSGTAVAVLADARRDQFFCSVYKISENGDSAMPLLSTQLVDRNDLPNLRNFAGVGASKLTLLAPQSCAGLLPDAAVQDARRIAFGLLKSFKNESFRAFKVEEIAAIQPNYIRSVAAKTIKERQVEAAGSGKTDEAVLT